MMTYSTCFTIYSTIWRILTRLSSCFLFSNLENENQEVFMESLGGLFNPEILKAAVATPNTSTVTLNELLNVNKADFTFHI